MSDAEPIRPLKDVWLRPRRVFRELANRPIGAPDYWLAAIQGVATSLMVYRSQLAGTGATGTQVLGSAFVFGPLGGIVSIYLFAAIYGRLGVRAGGNSARHQVFHVLAYGGVPVCASLILWIVTALIVGDSAIVEKPGVQLDGFPAFIVQAQLTAYLLLFLWSVLLQVMGFSETLGLSTKRAFAVWILGQLLWMFAALFLSALLALLFPGLVPASPH